jgi:thioredoxin reductase
VGLRHDADVAGACFVFSHTMVDDLIFIYGADITQQKKAERLLAEQAQALSEMARFPDMNPGPVLRMDRAGVIKLANRAAKQVFQRDPTGASWFDLCPGLSQELWQRILSTTEKIRRDDPYRIVTCADGTELSCYALLLATGVSVRMLELPGASDYGGRGLYYGAAMTEAAAYRGREVIVVGAANSAGQGALFFSRYASRVTMLVRADSLEKSMSQYLIERIRGAANIEVTLATQIVALEGAERLERVLVKSQSSGAQTTIDASGVFVFIGAAPKTEIVADLVERDEKGYILTGPDLFREGKRPKGWTPDRDPFLYETNVPGVFAAGDVRSGAGKRVAAAVGEGSATVGMVHRYLGSV